VLRTANVVASITVQEKLMAVGLQRYHVERNKENTGLQIWIEKETSLYCHLAAGSTTQLFSCRQVESTRRF